MDAKDKERLVDEFRACLDDLEAQDGDALASCTGSDTPPPVSLASLFAELSVLRNEVRVEARQFKSALDDMRVLTELLGVQNQRQAHDLERARESQKTAKRSAERRLLLDMLDIRDRISAALGVYSDYQPGFLARWATAETRLAQGLGDGIRLTLRRLDDALADMNVHPIAAVGGPLDPHTMHAVGAKSVADSPPGRVLSEVRRGYVRNDELLRLAEVIVNKSESEANHE